MPSLKVIAACETVIFNKQGIASLINIFQRLQFQMTTEPIPADALAPVKWSVYTQWEHEPGRAGTSYVQRIEIEDPSGKRFAESTLSFVHESAIDIQTKHQFEIFGMPIAQPGFITIKAWLEDVPNAYGEYHINLEHVVKDANVQEAISF